MVNVWFLERGGRRPPFIALRSSRGYSTSPLYMETLSTGRRLLRGYSSPRYTWTDAYSGLAEPGSRPTPM